MVLNVLNFKKSQDYFVFSQSSRIVKYNIAYLPYRYFLACLLCVLQFQ